MSSDWIPVRLSDVCTKIGSGSTPRGGGETYLEKGPFALIRSQNIYNDGFHLDGLAFIDENQARDLDNVEVLKDDVLLNITGDSVARCCQASESLLPARVNQHVAIVRPDSKKLNAKFLRYMLISPMLQAQLLSWAGSGGTRNALTKGMIESVELVVPEDVREQEAIANILGSLDDKIALNKRLIDVLAEISKAIFRDWFVDFGPVRAKEAGQNPPLLSKQISGLFPASLDGETPHNWNRRPLGELCTVGRGGSPRPIQDFMGGDIPWIKIADATAAYGPFLFQTAEFLKKEGLSKTVSVKPGDLILSNSATCGVPIFVELDGCIHDGWLYFKDYKKISKLYLYHALREISEHLVHIADGSVQKNLNTGLVSRQMIIVPDEPIMALFDSLATSIFEKIRLCGQESQTLAELRDALLPKLMTGTLPVNDVDRFIGRRP